MRVMAHRRVRYVQVGSGFWQGGVVCDALAATRYDSVLLGPERCVAFVRSVGLSFRPQHAESRCAACLLVSYRPLANNACLATSILPSLVG